MWTDTVSEFSWEHPYPASGCLLIGSRTLPEVNAAGYLCQTRYDTIHYLREYEYDHDLFSPHVVFFRIHFDLECPFCFMANTLGYWDGVCNLQWFQRLLLWHVDPDYNDFDHPFSRVSRREYGRQYLGRYNEDGTDLDETTTDVHLYPTRLVRPVLRRQQRYRRVAMSTQELLAELNGSRSVLLEFSPGSVDAMLLVPEYDVDSDGDANMVGEELD